MKLNVGRCLSGILPACAEMCAEAGRSPGIDKAALQACAAACRGINEFYRACADTCRSAHTIGRCC
jgi:hypothetical protein